MESCIRIMICERNRYHRDRMKRVIQTQRDFEIIFEGKTILEDIKNGFAGRTDIFIAGLDKFQAGWDFTFD